MHHALRGKGSNSREKQRLSKNSLVLQPCKAGVLGTFHSLPFTKIAHSITAQDHQPTPDSCILSMVVGQLKADDDPIMGFHQSFILKNINEAWVCTNDMFRLAIHNFG
ncbi:nuclear transport factor 2 isoform X3 [Brachyhypopomus gauderio]|uniref:nuclear transport factor 2 isoform X3 n=1 Tax=Brachyhypopomus gauderio TaxID=698409 RepID=UPI004041E0AA